MTPQQFDKIVAEARKIAFGEDGAGGKSSAYSPDLYKIIGMAGRCSDIWRKAIRFGNAVRMNKFDHLDDSDALDLINYAAMFLVVKREETGEFNDN